MAARYHAHLPRSQGKNRFKPFLHTEQVHGEFVQVHPDLLQACQVLDHRRLVLAPVTGQLVPDDRGVWLGLVTGVDLNSTDLAADLQVKVTYIVASLDYGAVLL